MFESASKSLLFSRLTAGFLLLTHYCGGQPQVVGPSQPITAISGDDIILPCHLEPAVDATTTAVEWTRLDLQPRFVHVWRSGEELLENQHPSFKDRTVVSVCRLNRGDLSLKLSNVKRSDAGKYRCFIPEFERNADAIVQLVVGLVSSPGVEVSKVSSGGVTLDCSSVGWYPEPEVLWLDGEGNLLSAGPTETVRGPDDLYTVSSRVTVEKRHSNSFTCRVQQKDTNQTREAHITVPAECFKAPSDSAARVGIIVTVVLIFILAAAFVWWKWKQNQIKETKKVETEKQQLMEENRRIEELKDKCAKHEEDHKTLEQKVKTLMEEQRKELQEQRNKITQQKEEMEKNIQNMEKELQSVEKMNESERFSRMKDIIYTAKYHLVKRKQADEDLDMAASNALFKTDILLNTVKKDEERK